jgi:hypothetical protein
VQTRVENPIVPVGDVPEALGFAIVDPIGMPNGMAIEKEAMGNLGVEDGPEAVEDLVP